MTSTTLLQDEQVVARLKVEPLALDVVSDLICPWCYIGQARLTQALDELTLSGIDVNVTWRAFELNPEMPPEGLDRKDYRTRKFGSWSRSQMMDEEVARTGKADGLDFNYERVSRTPNTRLSHRLAHRALREGSHELQNTVVEGLFKAYFTTGDDVGDPDTLIEIARECGMSDSGLSEYLRSTEDLDAVVREERLGANAGLRGVPSLLSGDQFLFSGAQPVEDIVRTLRGCT